MTDYQINYRIHRVLVVTDWLWHPMAVGVANILKVTQFLDHWFAICQH